MFPAEVSRQVSDPLLMVNTWASKDSLDFEVRYIFVIMVLIASWAISKYAWFLVSALCALSLENCLAVTRTRGPRYWLEANVFTHGYREYRIDALPFMLI